MNQFQKSQAEKILASYIQEDFLEKGGKRAFIGEVRNYNGQDWVKHQDGWVLVNHSTGKHLLERPGGKREIAEKHHVDHANHHLKVRSTKPAVDSSTEELESEYAELLIEATRNNNNLGSAKQTRLEEVGSEVQKRREALSKEKTDSSIPKNDIRHSDIEDSKGLWPDKLEYKGHNVFDIYVGDIQNKMAERLKIGETYWADVEEYDEENDEYYTDKEEVRIDGQESYLGYDPDSDTFISGWDMWDGDDSNTGLVFFKINDNGSTDVIKDDNYYGGMVYGSNGGYNHLQKQYPNLKDIRLD